MRPSSSATPVRSITIRVATEPSGASNATLSGLAVAICAGAGISRLEHFAIAISLHGGADFWAMSVSTVV